MSKFSRLNICLGLWELLNLFRAPLNKASKFTEKLSSVTVGYHYRGARKNQSDSLPADVKEREKRDNDGLMKKNRQVRCGILSA